MPRLVVVALALGLLAGARPARCADAPVIPAPNIPQKTFRVTDYGARGDGATLDTAALQKAIEACANGGGGIVDVPAGRYLTGPLTLGSRMDLRLDKGATLLLSDDIHQYKITRNRFQDCLVAKNAHDIAITGSGTIDGQGAFWWAHYVRPKHAPAGTTPLPHRPFLVVLTGCRRVLVQGITLTNSPMFHLVPQKCQDVRIEGIHIIAPQHAENTDGLDPSGWNFLIRDCTFNVGDDCIALKPSGRIDPSQPACRNFLIEDCTFEHGHGMSVGGQTPGGLNGLTVRDCTFHGTDAGIRLKAPRGSGGLVENLTYENLKMTDVKVPILITSYYADSSPGETPVDPAHDKAQPVNATTPIWRHIVIRNVTAIGSKVDGEIYGLPEMPVSNVTLTNVDLSGKRGMQVFHARGIRFINCHISAQSGPPLAVADAQITGIVTRPAE
jgi:polygalacturonase